MIRFTNRCKEREEIVEKIIKVMGPGCGNKELEHCPPLVHIELTEQELLGALKDPASVGKQMGLQHPIDSIHVSQQGSGNRAAPTGAAPVDPPDQIQAIYCCVNCLSSSLCCQVWENPM